MDTERKAGNGIRVTIDPENLRSCKALWKDSVDVKIPMKDDFKLHFIAKRREITEFCDWAKAEIAKFNGLANEG